MKTNNVIITLGGNNAVLMTEKSFAVNKFQAFRATSAFVAALQALNTILDKVSDNNTIDEAVTTIHVPNVLKGFTANHTVREYVRTNKTKSSDKLFTEEEKQLVHEVAAKMMNKGLNLEIKESRFFPKDLKPMKDMAFAKATELKSQAPVAAPQAQPQPTKDSVVAKLEELMAKALEEGDFEAYDKLEERLNKRLASTPAPVATAPVVEEEPVEEENYDDLEDNAVEVEEDIADMDC